MPLTDARRVNSKAVVLLSGGQDSTTCFYKALDDYDEIAAVAFDYGQRHRVELELARATALDEDVPFTIIPVEALSLLGAASLTNPAIANVGDESTEFAEVNAWATERGLPPSFVPGRNLLFFTLAAAWGVPRGYDVIVTGVCEQDAAGYPDCRAETVDSMADSIRFGFDCPSFAIDAPLLELDKASTWALAASMGRTNEIVKGTHTCYEGVRDELHEWGYGCGNCGACVERARGYAEWQVNRSTGLSPAP